VAPDGATLGQRVLIVDDNRDLAENLAELFEHAGHRVTLAGSLAEAKARMAGEPCDLALLDIRLPDASGVDLASLVKAQCADAEVVLMTGNASLDTAIAAVRGGAYAYVQKPFDVEDLLALCGRALSQVSLRRERARLQRELSQSDALHRAVVDEVDAFIVGLDPGGEIRMWNRSAALCTGFDPAEVLGRPLAALLASEHSARRLAEALQLAQAGEQTANLELPLATRDGLHRVVRWHLSPLPLSEPGTNPVVLAVGLDLTDRLELERRAAEAEAMAAIGSLTAGLAHEIRNPLNAAVLQLELLQRSAAKLEDAALKERIDLRVNVVRQELERLTRLLGDFLNLAKPRALDLTTVDLGQLLGDVAALQEPVAKTAGLTLASRLEPGGLLARGEPALLKQVVVNLVVNAIDAMRERGHGRIDVVCHNTSANRVELSVEDDGPGIPEEIRQRMFVPFVTSKEAGTGLGLTIVKRIVDRHGGTIAVSSTAGRGTRVSVSLPRAR
jgi:PAS domain S-box-containing protein